jgi:hypothetical protein
VIWNQASHHERAGHRACAANLAATAVRAQTSGIAKRLRSTASVESGYAEEMMTKQPRTFAEFMRQAHERALPVEVLEDLARLERDGVEVENQDEEGSDG